MKGSLHTDELMGTVVSPHGGIHTERCVSHCFIMDVRGYPEPHIITDAAVNIAPDLDAKADIVQNAIDLLGRWGSRGSRGDLKRDGDGDGQSPLNNRSCSIVQNGGSGADSRCACRWAAGARQGVKGAILMGDSVHVVVDSADRRSRERKAALERAALAAATSSASRHRSRTCSSRSSPEGTKGDACQRDQDHRRSSDQAFRRFRRGRRRQLRGESGRNHRLPRPQWRGQVNYDSNPVRTFAPVGATIALSVGMIVLVIFMAMGAAPMWTGEDQVDLCGGIGPLPIEALKLKYRRRQTNRRVAQRYYLQARRGCPRHVRQRTTPCLRTAKMRVAISIRLHLGDRS